MIELIKKIFSKKSEEQRIMTAIEKDNYKEVLKYL